MNAKQAASVWSECQRRGLNAVARRIDRGELAGLHAVELEPPLHGADMAGLATLAEERGLVLTYGLAARRVVTLS